MGIIVGFTTLAVLISLGKPVWLSLLSSSLVMSLVGGGPFHLLDTVKYTATSTTAIDLVTITFLIAIFVNLYRTSGFLSKLGEELIKVLKRPKAIVTLVPAVMGLLPVAGGALMSAPVVDSVGDSLGLSKRLKLFINVWFRHVIFLVYPLSTALITVASLAGVSVWDLVLRQMPVVLSMVIVGYILGFKSARKPFAHNTERPNTSLLISVFSPIVVAILFAVTFSPLLDRQLVPYIPITRYSMVFGLILAITVLIKLSRRPFRGIVKAILSKTTLELVVAAFSAILLRDTFVNLGGPSVISDIIPRGTKTVELILLSITPFVLSFATGSPLTGCVVAISVFQPVLSIGVEEASLIYASNMLGYLISPAHLCYVYSAQYFEQPLASAYREMLVGVLFVLLTAIGTYFICSFFHGLVNPVI